MMSLLTTLYTELLWRPLFNLLLILYVFLPLRDFGVAIIVMTIIIRGLLAPLLWKSQQQQKRMAGIQPEVKRLQEQFKNDREGQGRALMELYAKHHVNPFSGCLILALQLPLFIALLHVFQRGFDASQLAHLYSFVPRLEEINPIAFGALDLARGSVIMGVIAAATQFLQTKLSTPPPVAQDNSFSKMLNMQALYIFPLLILFWSRTFPAALMLYWTVMNVFAIVQELIMRNMQATRQKMNATPSTLNSNSD